MRTIYNPRMFSKYPGTCKACGGYFAVGTEIDWEPGKGARHVKCPTKAKSVPAKPASPPIAFVTGGVQTPAGTNKKPGRCDRCGTWLKPGEGILQYCHYDTGCMKHFDESGYHLYCKDETTCAQRRAEAKAAAEVRRKRNAALSALIPMNWIEGKASQKVTSIPSTKHSLKINAYSGTSGSVDKGTLFVVGDDVYYYHGGYYDDFRDTTLLLPGQASALIGLISDLGVGGEKKIEVGDVRIYIEPASSKPNPYRLSRTLLRPYSHRHQVRQESFGLVGLAIAGAIVWWLARR